MKPLSRHLPAGAIALLHRFGIRRRHLAALSAILLAAHGSAAMKSNDQQVTRGPGGRILTNTGVWSPDSQWIVYDTRSDPEGAVFDGRRIEMVHVGTGEVRTLYEAAHGARCGVATFHPREHRVIFILGPEHPTPDWSYNACHRQGVMVDVRQPGHAIPVDARDIVPPFTPGALRGGSHVHVWDAAGEWLSFTYEDHVLAGFAEENADHEMNLRNVGVSVPGRPVRVKRDHPRNHDGEFFSVLATRTTGRPRPGSDDIQRAFEEGWVGTNGYVRADGTRQRRAIAFQGQAITAKGDPIAEVYIVDLPDRVGDASGDELAGTATRRPAPPAGTAQRRLTCTANRPHPGIQGPRHWLRSSPDGTQIGFLMKDEAGIVQIWTVSPLGGPPSQITRNPWPIASAFTWSPDGRHIAHGMDRSVCVTEVATGRTIRWTEPVDPAAAPRPEACVFSPDGRGIAYVRRIPSPVEPANQIFVVRGPGDIP